MITALARDRFCTYSDLESSLTEQLEVAVTTVAPSARRKTAGYPTQFPRQQCM